MTTQQIEMREQRESLFLQVIVSGGINAEESISWHLVVETKLISGHEDLKCVFTNVSGRRFLYWCLTSSHGPFFSLLSDMKWKV